jgi:hypothetical protein
VVCSSFKIFEVLRSNSFGHQPGDQGAEAACEAATIAAMGVPGIGEHECVMTENQRWSIRHREYRTDALIPKVVQMPSLSCSREVERCVGYPPEGSVCAYLSPIWPSHRCSASFGGLSMYLQLVPISWSTVFCVLEWHPSSSLGCPFVWVVAVTQNRPICGSKRSRLL